MTMFKELEVGQRFYFAHDPRRRVCTKLSGGWRGHYRVELADWAAHDIHTVDDDTISVVEWRPHGIGDPPPHAPEAAHRE